MQLAAPHAVVSFIKKKMKLEWKALIIGIIGTAIMAFSGVMLSMEIASLGLAEWLNTHGGTVNETLVSEYYAQPKIITLNIALTAIGFGLGGFVTGVYSKSQEILVACFASVIPAILLLSYFLPLFVVSSICGGYIAKKRKKANQ